MHSEQKNLSHSFYNEVEIEGGMFFLNTGTVLTAWHHIPTHHSLDIPHHMTVPNPV
jgi:hypothetical protein